MRMLSGGCGSDEDDRSGLADVENFAEDDNDDDDDEKEDEGDEF